MQKKRPISLVSDLNIQTNEQSSVTHFVTVGHIATGAAKVVKEFTTTIAMKTNKRKPKQVEGSQESQNGSDESE